MRIYTVGTGTGILLCGQPDSHHPKTTQPFPVAEGKKVKNDTTTTQIALYEGI